MRLRLSKRDSGAGRTLDWRCERSGWADRRKRRRRRMNHGRRSGLGRRTDHRRQIARHAHDNARFASSSEAGNRQSRIMPIGQIASVAEIEFASIFVALETEPIEMARRNWHAAEVDGWPASGRGRRPRRLAGAVEPPRRRRGKAKRPSGQGSRVLRGRTRRPLAAPRADDGGLRRRIFPGAVLDKKVQDFADDDQTRPTLRHLRHGPHRGFPRR